MEPQSVPCVHQGPPCHHQSHLPHAASAVLLPDMSRLCAGALVPFPSHSRAGPFASVLYETPKKSLGCTEYKDLTTVY